MEKLIEIKNLTKTFKLKGKKKLFAVNDVSFHINKGETFGLVGESGSGKSTLGRSITRLYETDNGEVLYEGLDISKLKNKKLNPYKKKMQIIFQDPYSSLNPYRNVREILTEPIKIHFKYKESEIEEKITSVLKQVGLNKDCLEKYPHEFSGGQRQRIGIARAIIVEPEFILCDEPISALDVSIQAQVVNTLKDIQEKTGVTYLFVAHDLAMVKYISDRIGVMYLGKLVEIGEAESLYKNPKHPYTKTLLAALPSIGKEKKEEEILNDEIATHKDLINGCAFAPRCKYKTEKCEREIPLLKDIDENYKVACFLYDEKS